MHPETELFLNSLPHTYRTLVEAEIRKCAEKEGVSLELIRVQSVQINVDRDNIYVKVELFSDKSVDQVMIASELF